MNCRNKESELQKRKDELGVLRHREEELRALVESQRAAEERGTQHREVKRGELEESEMEVRVLGNMAASTREDIVVVKNRLHILEVELRRNRIMLQQEKERYHATVESKGRTDKMANLLAQKFQKEREERQAELTIKSSTVRGVKGLKEEAKVRASHLEQLADDVMLEKDDSEKRFKRLMLAHKFLSQLLKDKMQREMNRFRSIEDAFKSIKIATGVGETGELVSKYLNKEAAYGQLLFKIADNERKIEVLRGESERLGKQQKGLQEEMNQFEVPTRGKVDLQASFKKLKDQEEIAKRTQVIEYNLKSWIRRTTRKIMLVSNSKVPADDTALEVLLKTIKDLASGCKGEKVAAGPAEDIVSKEYQERNVRVGRQEELKEAEE